MKAAVVGGVSLRSLLISLPVFLLHAGLGGRIISQPTLLVQKFSERTVFFQARSIMEIILLDIEALRYDEGDNS
jgi:hypothetical protein